MPLTTPSLRLIDAQGEVRPLEEIEREVIRFAIAHYRGQMSEVARRLQIGRSTLYRKLESLGLDEAPRETASRKARRRKLVNARALTIRRAALAVIEGKRTQAAGFHSSASRSAHNAIAYHAWREGRSRNARARLMCGRARVEFVHA